MPRDALKQYKQKNTPAYDQAVDNVLADLWHAEINPHGNITEIAQRALAARRAEDDPPDFAARAAKLRSPLSTSGAKPRATPVEPLRRVVPRADFIQHNLEDMSGQDDFAHSPVLASCEMYAGDLTGHTGKPGDISWWTFGGTAPTSGADYAESLALPYENIRKACRTLGWVEVEISSKAFPEALYKPSALDGFCANTRFRPDRSDKPYGITAPAVPPSRKELVALSFPYDKVFKKPDDYVKVTLFPSQAR